MPGHLAADDAVSPVIGVILMVAITVVLAATIFLMLGNLAEDTETPRFPQVKFRDAAQPTDGLDAEVLTMEHLAGDCVTLTDYRFIAEKPDGSTFEPAVTDNDDDIWCVGDTLSIGETSAMQLAAADAGALLRLRVVHLASESVVFSQAEQLT